MKKLRQLISLTLCLAALMSTTVSHTHAAGGTAYASTQAVEVDGKKIEFQMYALRDANGNATNYVKLRDVAHVLNGTPAQFSVGWDGSISVTTGQPYTDTGAEMTTPYSGDRVYQTGSGSVLVDGKAANLEAIVLTDDDGGGYTYFKLRDLGAALGFTVDWSAQRGVIVSTGEPVAPKPSEATLANGKPATEANVLAIMAEIEREYPTGTSWDDFGKNPNKVSTPVFTVISSTHATSSNIGCGGFASMVSDRIFGYDAPCRKVDDVTDIRPGDIIVHLDKNGKPTHVSIAMSSVLNEYNYVARCEGNNNSIVRWPTDGDLNTARPTAAKPWAIYTRYPE